MKRLLVLVAVGAAAALVPSPASADHICVSSGGKEIYCYRHVQIDREEVCVTSGGRELACV